MEVSPSAYLCPSFKKLNIVFRLRMKKLLTILMFLMGVLVLILPNGCFYDNEEELYGPDNSLNCDTTNIRYSVEIKQILADKCNSCHLESSPSYSGIPYETYDQFREVAQNGKLVDRINSLSAPMPQTGLMDKCNREKLEAWVKAGAPNN